MIAKQVTQWFAALSLILLVGCANITKDNFNDHAAKAVSGANALVATATEASKVNKITKADLENTVKSADLVIEGVKVSRSYVTINQNQANSKLAQTIAILTAAQAYLAAQGVK